MAEGKPRDMQFYCSKCDKDFLYEIPFGCFVNHVPGVSCEIIEERPARSDNFYSAVVCPVCGCQGGLTIVEQPKAKEEEKHDGSV